MKFIFFREIFADLVLDPNPQLLLLLMENLQAEAPPRGEALARALLLRKNRSKALTFLNDGGDAGYIYFMIRSTCITIKWS